MIKYSSNCSDISVWFDHLGDFTEVHIFKQWSSRYDREMWCVSLDHKGVRQHLWRQYTTFLQAWRATR